MTAILLKKDQVFHVMDPYYGGLWELDRVGIEQYLKFLEIYKNDEVSTEKIKKKYSKIISQEMIDFMIKEKMPIDTTYFPRVILENINEAEDGIIVPPEIILEVNRKCNYRCPWCYIPTMEEQDETLTLKEIEEQIIIPFVNKGAKCWTLTGGEPSVTFERTLSIVKMISKYTKEKHGEEADISILSNGYKFSEYAEKYFEAGVSKVQFQLSSPYEEEEIKLRNPKGGINSFEHVIEGVKKANELRYFTSINMVVSPDKNIKGIKDMILLADNLKLDMLRITPVVMAGMAKENGICLDIENYTKIKNNTKAGRELLKEDSTLEIYLPHFDLENDRPMRCGLGFIDFYIDYRGIVFPCNNLIDDELKCDPGTIKEFTGPEIWFGSKMLNRFRDYLNTNIGEECGACEYRGMCVGNCIARCWQRYGKFDLLEMPKECFRTI
ncbi:radical SAM/SPASM domain-containing protein [Oceanirhabdus seepicola]|uniref:Radical SAM protein n=1 Tax=Oceanirhabdus seepicola TaxID=2828781 RepID=A0A9J6P9J4_9CLOT|nr:radical SAM protein [Oceanirhabdus seepicola]MCM1992772.1 radical SAM protein [Oceanirhabdus seepicola]